MYEKDEDEYNVGLQFRMAKDIFKQPKPKVIARRPNPISNPIIKTVNDAIVDEGATQFAGHEDVIKRFLGV